MKKLIYISWNSRSLDHSCALLQHQDTPSRKDELYPAQKLYGHLIQDSLPVHRCAYLQKWQRKAGAAE